MVGLAQTAAPAAKSRRAEQWKRGQASGSPLAVSPPDAEENGVRLTMSEANATVVTDLLAVVPEDVLGINGIRAVAL